VWTIGDEDKVSIDRIDSDGGYTPDNIQLVTKRINVAKSDMSEDAFLIMVSNIVEHQEVSEERYEPSQLQLKSMYNGCNSRSRTRQRSGRICTVDIDKKDILD